jgi:hypothetical protein
MNFSRLNTHTKKAQAELGLPLSKLEQLNFKKLVHIWVSHVKKACQFIEDPLLGDLVKSLAIIHDELSKEELNYTYLMHSVIDAMNSASLIAMNKERDYELAFSRILPSAIAKDLEAFLARLTSQDIIPFEKGQSSASSEVELKDTVDGTQLFYASLLSPVKQQTVLELVQTDKQEIKPNPVDCLFIINVSASMGLLYCGEKTRIDVVKELLIDLVKKISPYISSGNVHVITFSDTANYFGPFAFAPPNEQAEINANQSPIDSFFLNLCLEGEGTNTAAVYHELANKLLRKEIQFNHPVHLYTLTDGDFNRNIINHPPYKNNQGGNLAAIKDLITKHTDQEVFDTFIGIDLVYWQRYPLSCSQAYAIFP